MDLKYIYTHTQPRYKSISSVDPFIIVINPSQPFPFLYTIMNKIYCKIFVLKKTLETSRSKEKKSCQTLGKKEMQTNLQVQWGPKRKIADTVLFRNWKRERERERERE